MKLTICWLRPSREPETRKKLLYRFNIPDYLSVNFETPCEIREEDLELLRECERRGFIQIRNK